MTEPPVMIMSMTCRSGGLRSISSSRELSGVRWLIERRLAGVDVCHTQTLI